MADGTKSETPKNTETPGSDLEAPKITSVIKTEKIKDPKRVAAGKRLAQISKAAKERKARERLAAETGLGVGGNWSTCYGYLIGTAGLVIGGASLYYSMRKEKREVQRLEETVVKSQPQNAVAQIRASEVLDSFDE